MPPGACLRAQLVPAGSCEESRRRVTLDLELPGEFLGQGSFGQVHKHRDWQSGGRPRVLKTVAAPPGWGHEALVHEAEVLRSLDHPHIVRIFAWHESEGSLSMLLEFCAGGELVEAVREGRRGFDGEDMPESWAAVLVRQLLQALAYCHSRGLIHKDLKSDNILLLKAPAPGQRIFQTWPHVVLADWGLSEYCSRSWVVFQRRGRTVAGTAYTMAPEVWKGSCGPKSDVWSLGCVLFQLLVNRMPFDPPDAAMENIPHDVVARVFLALHERGPIWSQMRASKDVEDLCRQMLRFKEKDRPQAKMCLEHCWILKHSCRGQAPPSEVEAACQSLCLWQHRHPFQRALCIKIAASHTSTGQIPAIFAQFDLDHDGALSTSELVAALKSSGAAVGSSARRAAAALCLGSGHVCEYTEFAGACLVSLGEYDSIMQLEIRALDPKGSGSIGSGAVAALFDGLRSLLPEQERWGLQAPELGREEPDGAVPVQRLAEFFGQKPIPCQQIARKRTARQETDRKVPVGAIRSTRSTRGGGCGCKPTGQCRTPAPLKPIVHNVQMRQLQSCSSSRRNSSGSSSSAASSASGESHSDWSSSEGSAITRQRLASSASAPAAAATVGGGSASSQGSHLVRASSAQSSRPMTCGTGDSSELLARPEASQANRFHDACMGADSSVPARCCDGSFALHRQSDGTDAATEEDSTGIVRSGRSIVSL